MSRYYFNFTPAIKVSIRAVLSVHDGTAEIARALALPGKTVLSLSECKTLAEIVDPYYSFVSTRIRRAIVGCLDAPAPEAPEAKETR